MTPMCQPSELNAALCIVPSWPRSGSPVRGHEELLTGAAFSPDGRRSSPRRLTAALRQTFFLPPEPPAWCIEMQK